MPFESQLVTMREAVAAFGSGNLQRMSAVFDPGVVWTVPGCSPVAGVYRGRDATFAFFGGLMSRSGGTFAIEPLEMFANDTGGVFVDRITATRGDRRLDVRLLLHVRITNGCIVAGTDYFHDLHAWDAFWS